MAKRLIYVTTSKIVECRVALIIEDEADMNAQLAIREEKLKEKKFVVKPERERNGTLKTHELSPDWERYQAHHNW